VNPLEVARRQLGHVPAGGRAARHRDSLDIRAGGQILADHRARPGDHLVSRGRYARLFDDGRDLQQGEGAFGRRLGDHGISGRQGRRCFVCVQFHGVVERNDGRHHAHWLADRHRQVPLLSGDRVHRNDAPKHPLGFFAEAAEDARRDSDFSAGLLDRLAVLPGQELA